MIASVLFNEKILILFAGWLALRLVFSADGRAFFGEEVVIHDV